MNPVPADAINSIPDSIKATREECQDAADSQLLVLFTMANELEAKPELPPILSGKGVEVYPLPSPWEYRAPLDRRGDIDTREVASTVNEFLPHTKKNAEAYNEALAVNDLPTAVKIAEQGVKDSAYIWSTTNALAQSVETASVYKTLALSTETKQMYNQASIKTKIS